MVLLAATAAGAETGPSIISIMKRTVNSSSDDYSFIQLTDVTGKVLSSTDPKSNINPAGAEWFRTAASGQSSLTTVMRVGIDCNGSSRSPLSAGTARSKESLSPICGRKY